MRTSRFAFALVIAAVLTGLAAGPAAAGASVDRSRTAYVDECHDLWDQDPETGEWFFDRFCVTGEWILRTTTTPSGVVVYSGSIESDSRVYFMGELLTSREVKSDRFNSLTRDAVQHVFQQNLTTHVENPVTGEVRDCYVRVVIVGGAIRHGAPELVCEGEDPGQGEG